MISKDFVYVKPENLKEAYEIYKDYEKKGLTPFYYSGGTEIVTFSRKGLISPDILIDLKNIKECKDLYFDNDNLIIGSTVSLNMLVDSNYSKIISKSIRFIADRTTRNKITVGGNVVGQLPFREVVLPLLLLDSKVRIYTSEGFKEFNINEIFDKNLKITKGDIVVQFILKKEFLNLDFYYDRKVFFSRVDYPIVSTLFVKNTSIKMAITGAFNFPLRDKESEDILNQKDLNLSEIVKKIVERLSPLFKSDFRASKEYRIELFKIILNDALRYFGRS
ncbi:MAG: FAD binding domain-containing protein [Caldisericia bacterium]|jgi:CO/xanthine dehydrogenase FAD-binding subunit|nr:FAD binding domain-containing protein [Caldisericia bacterium]